jgi:hypothetical protein
MENEQDGFLCKRAIEARQRGGYQPQADGKKWCNPPKSRDGSHNQRDCLKDIFSVDNARGIPFTLPETLNNRERIAAMAMQGILSSITDEMDDMSPVDVAVYAVKYADALLAELEKTK